MKREVFKECRIQGLREPLARGESYLKGAIKVSSVLGSLTGRNGGPASGVKGFVKAAASVQERTGRYRWGWAQRQWATGGQMGHTHYGKGEGLGKQSPIKETA